MTLNEDCAARFWAKVDRRGDSECWPWVGASCRDGYGQLRVSGKLYVATHIALQFHGTPRPEGFLALHSCDNSKCVNPTHLRWGTHDENTADRIKRKGLGNKLSEQTARDILSSPLSISKTAKQFGVRYKTVWNIKNGKRWPHLQNDPTQYRRAAPVSRTVPPTMRGTCPASLQVTTSLAGRFFETGANQHHDGVNTL